MRGSLIGSTIADVLKSESPLRLLKLEVAAAQTAEQWKGHGIVPILGPFVMWQTRSTTFGFQRISEVARVCGQTGL